MKSDVVRTCVWSPLRRYAAVRCEDGLTRPAFELSARTLADPLRWVHPRDVVVGDDPFAPFVEIEAAAAIFAVMASAPRSTFRVRTENAETMRPWMAWIALGGASAVAIYNAGHEVHYPSIVGEVSPPTPELRFLYDVGAPRVNPHLRGRAARRGGMPQYHWSPWPLRNVVVEAPTTATVPTPTSDHVDAPA